MNVHNTCEKPIDFLGGRSIPLESRILHLWGSVAPGAGLQSQYVDATREGGIANQCREAHGGLWQITTTAKEYRRSGEGPFLPLPDNAISQVPAGVAPFTLRTQVQLRVSANDGVDTREFDMDANQSITIVAAANVCVKWLGPAGMLDVLNLPNNQRELPLSGMVIDAFLGVAVSRIEESPGDNSTVLLTRHLFVPDQTRASIAIPAYASEVTIYQEPTLGTASTMWTQTYGDPNGGSGFMSIGALPFIPGQRRTQQQSILPNASHLWTDIDPDFDRFYTLVWTIRP